MLKKILMITLVLGLSGCASVPKETLEQSSADEMRANDIVVAFSYPSKKINYSEMVYKVLWNETHTSDASFKGIWDIDRDLSHQFSQQFQNQGLRAVSIDEVLNGNEYEKYSDLMATSIINAQESEKFKLDEKLRSSLVEKGYEYLIALRGLIIQAQVYSLFSPDPYVNLSYRMRVINLKNNSVEYTNVFMLRTYPDVVKSPREIEDNKLAILRAELSKSIRASFGGGGITESMGLVAVPK
ncbi:MAG: hypothetical protein ABW168_06980 [Sedimenticola sp.]